ncbi:alpha/beta hydrolase [Desulforegula conservatrix]|uniref:alpha/beta hydrolase n=1 Tax=Desulforegula conservatrix TaxID=153026 RepID=UPI0004184295|nr:alpha/beta hydrolase [Desulforegula conservatrix]
MKFFRFILVLCLLVTMTNVSFAGPIRNWIAEKRAQDNHDDLGNDENLTYGKINLPQGVRLIRDVPYGSDGKQRMDIYIPEKAKDAPVIFMVHGGAWRTGDKAASGVVENKVARWVPKGIIFISANYRLLPDANPLIQEDDVILAIKKAQKDAEKWGGDPSKFILMGHSAGAHLVSLVSADPQKAKKAGAKPWLGTVSLDSAAYDISETMMSKHYRFYDKAFGKDPALWKTASPVHMLSEGANPFFAVCSSIRPDSPCTQARNFAEKGISLGIRIEISEQAMTHADINKKLGISGAYTESVEAFMSSLDERIKKCLDGI